MMTKRQHTPSTLFIEHPVYCDCLRMPLRVFNCHLFASVQRWSNTDRFLILSFDWHRLFGSIQTHILSRCQVHKSICCEIVALLVVLTSNVSLYITLFYNIHRSDFRSINSSYKYIWLIYFIFFISIGWIQHPSLRVHSVVI